MKSSNNSPLSLRIIDALRAGYLDVVSEEVSLSPSYYLHLLLMLFPLHLVLLSGCCSNMP